MKAVSFEEIAAANYNTLLRLAVQHTGNRSEAEDIVQETFLKLLESRREFADEGHAKGYLIRSVINRCRDYHKSARRRYNIALSEAEENRLPADSGGFADDLTQTVLDAVQTLRPEYRDVVYLYYYEEYTIREIAALLHRSSNTVSTWLTRARKQLREVLNDEQDGLQERHAADFRRQGGDPYESKTNAGAV